MKESLFFLTLFLFLFSLETERINIDNTFVVVKNVLSQMENSFHSSSDLVLFGENGNVVVEWEKDNENESSWFPIQKNAYKSEHCFSSINEKVNITEYGLYRMSVVTTVDGVSSFLVSLIKAVPDIETDNAKVTEDNIAVYGKRLFCS